MAETSPAGRVRDWFTDARGPGRRMHVSHHPEDGLVVFSLWEGDRCRATFRMPTDDAARLLHDLVDVVASSPSSAVGRPAEAVASARPLAPVVRLRDRRP